MYTPDQYQRARAQLSSASPDTPRYSEIKAKVSEFERYNPDHATIGEGEAHAQSGETLKSSEPAALLELPKESPAESAAQFSSAPATPPTESAPVEADLSSIVAAPDLQAKRDAARKLLEAPPEYVSKTRSSLGQKALGTLIDPLDGPMVGNYYEPTERQFEADMGQVLKARGITKLLDNGLTPNDEYTEAFGEYKDRKWKQAYEQAKAEDRPLQRVERLKDSPGWQSLAKYLAAQAPDAASAFAKGYAAGGTLHGSTAITALSDAATVGNTTDLDREQAERNPIASGAGELLGSMREGGPLAKIAGGASKFAAKYLPGMAGRIASSAIGGAAVGEADLAARSLATAAGDVAQGRSTESAKDQFTSNLLGTGLIGGGLGALGGVVAEGANAYQKSVSAQFPEIAQLRRGGGDTSMLSGVKPGEEVAANVEAAREPVFGEAKTIAGSTPTEVAAAKVQQPLAEANAGAHKDLHAQIAAEREAALAADPKLAEPKPLTKTANAAVDWVLAKLQPEALKKYLPGMRPSARKVAPAADAATAAKLAEQLWKPRLVTGVEAANEARQAGGRIISVDDAQRLGIDVSKLEGFNATPSAAPEAPAHWADQLPEGPSAKTAKLLPKYSLDDLDTFREGSAANATPEELAALARSTYGKSALQPGDEEILQGYLERAPVSKFPHVYRGMALSPERAAELLERGGFTTEGVVTSTSFDPHQAITFANRNKKPGDIGIVFKLEHQSARDISQLPGAARVGTEKELLLPPGRRFEIVDKQPNPANPNDWIVTAREAPDSSAGSTTEDIFGRPADKITPSPVDRLKPREGRAKPPPVPEPGSDWDDRGRAKSRFDFIFHDHVEPDPFPATPNEDPTRVTNSPPLPPPSPPISIGAPSRPPPGLRMNATPAASSAQAAGLPPSEFRVVLEPRAYDARKLEGVVGDIDLQAKAGKANANPDPQWKLIQKAIREDRNQFGPEWSKMIARHHEQLNSIEQRSARAGLAEAKIYPEMQPNNQQAFDSKLEGFPGNKKASDALRSIASDASPKVLRELEVLGATNAYSKLKNLATPKLSENVGIGGAITRLRGAGPALKLRGEALARRLAAGPTGEPTISPAVLDYVRAKVPGRKFLPGNIAVGAGALGLKGGVAYNSANDKSSRGTSLSPEQIQFLGQLLDAVAAPSEATQ